jgi:hypothetical protein
MTTASIIAGLSITIATANNLAVATQPSVENTRRFADD